MIKSYELEARKCDTPKELLGAAIVQQLNNSLTESNWHNESPHCKGVSGFYQVHLYSQLSTTICGFLK
nr:hypothetical protein CFP56_72973 [Quercus suber]